MIGAPQPLVLAKPAAIDTAQAARYFGARGEPDDRTMTLLETCAMPLLAAATPRAVWLEADTAALAEAGILRGGDVMKHLENCPQAVLLAVTLGPGVDAQIRRAGVGDIAAGVASDALGSALAEQAADAAEAVFYRQGQEHLAVGLDPGQGEDGVAFQGQAGDAEARGAAVGRGGAGEQGQGCGHGGFQRAHGEAQGFEGGLQAHGAGHGGGAAGLPVHGYAHLLAIASVRGGSIDVIDGHEHQPGSVFTHAAGPLAHALLAVSERLLGIVSRKRIRQLVDDGALLQQTFGGYDAEVAFLHSGVERGCRREIPWFEQAHERNVDEIGLRPRPVEHLEVHERLFARYLPGKRCHHAQVGKLHGHVREGHLLLDGLVHVVPGEGFGVLAHERKGVRTRLLCGNTAGKGLFENVFRPCPWKGAC